MLLNRLFVALFGLALLIPPGFCGEACAKSAAVEEAAVPSCCHRQAPAHSDGAGEEPASVPSRCCCVRDGVALKKVAPPTDDLQAVMPATVVDLYGSVRSNRTVEFVPVVDPPRQRLHLLQCVWQC